MPKDYMLLYGKNPVLERLKTNHKSIRRIFVQENFDSRDIMHLIKSNRIPFKYVTEKELLRVKYADRLQGIVAEIDKFAYTPFKELIYKPENKNLSLIFLDNLTDPHNLGSIIRIAACFGNFVVIFPEHESCEVTDSVLHVANGGENFVPVCKVVNLSNALIDAKKAGFWIAGAVVEGGEDINNVKFPFPISLVLGSEGTGIRHAIEKQLDIKASLPMRGTALSFNVAMACAIFCHEIAKQRQKI